MLNIFGSLPCDVAVFTEATREPEAPSRSWRTSGTTRLIRRRYVSSGVPRPQSRVAKLLMMLAWTAEILLLSALQRPPCIVVSDAYPVGFLAAIVKALLRIPYIAIVYGEEVTHLRTLRLRRFLLRRTLRYADKVITISQFTKSLLEKEGVTPSRIAVIPPGVDAAEINPTVDPSDVERRHKLSGRTVLLSVGRLTERKGHALMLELLPSILKTTPAVTYLIVGQDVAEGEKLKTLIDRYDLKNVVQLVGPASQDELPKYYAACDIFVLLTHDVENTDDTEGFGMVFLEAGAAGKPVVAGIAGGTSEAVADGTVGFLVDTNREGAALEALRKLLSDETLRAHLGSNGRRRVLEEFSWPSRVTEFSRILQSVASRDAH
jgi:phosphatidylinositol alpha-1,6-mannosyltransferase